MFDAMVTPPQIRSVPFPVQDDFIALERDEYFTLRLRNLGNLQEGAPSVMNITLVDDDGKLLQ